MYFMKDEFNDINMAFSIEGHRNPIIISNKIGTEFHNDYIFGASPTYRCVMMKLLTYTHYYMYKIII